MRNLATAIWSRAESLEALAGLSLIGAGVALTLSIGAALIVVGAIVFGLAVWPQLRRRGWR